MEPGVELPQVQTTDKHHIGNNRGRCRSLNPNAVPGGLRLPLISRFVLRIDRIEKMLHEMST
jgi:hypothetical protein